MKEKSSKKESIKKEAKQEGRNVTVFALSESKKPVGLDLKIDWDAFLRFFNAAREAMTPIFTFAAEKKRAAPLPLRNFNAKNLLQGLSSSSTFAAEKERPSPLPKEGASTQKRPPWLGATSRKRALQTRTVLPSNSIN